MFLKLFCICFGIYLKLVYSQSLDLRKANMFCDGSCRRVARGLAREGSRGPPLCLVFTALVSASHAARARRTCTRLAYQIRAASVGRPRGHLRRSHILRSVLPRSVTSRVNNLFIALPYLPNALHCYLVHPPVLTFL